MDLKTSNTHLEAARLVADTLDAWEQAHIDSCVRCRSERRLRKTPDTAPAQRIGPYVVLGEIGSGGMGRVYAVWHPEREEKRAIKVLTLESRSARERFLREARAQQRVVHENVLPVLEVLALSEGPALVLPLVRGPSLAVLLAQYKPSQVESLALFRGLCAGVAAIHEAHLVHRDLKPSNVLLDASGDALQVRVADFGLVKVLAESTDEMLTRSGIQLGTPAYMAPEQRIDPKRIDARADVWSLGAILYEMLCGQVPKDLRQLQIPEIAPWDGLISEMLAVDPSERPVDAAAVLERLPPTEASGDALFAACRALAPVPIEAHPSDIDDNGSQSPEDLDSAEQERSSRRRFEIGGLLGAGGFGEVYRATMYSNGGLRQDVAVKFLRDPDPKALVRLEREGELLARLRHPAILKVYDLVRLQGQVALVTEYVAGMDLAEAFHAHPPLPERAVLDTVSIVAEALCAASSPLATDIDASVQLVHRDIKPPNIRIGIHGEIKLLDFGVAWSGNRDNTHGDSFIGSVPYMAPERFRRERAQPAGDIYALGCVFYEGLAHALLHAGQDVQEIFAHTSLLAGSQELHDRFVEEALGKLDAPPALSRLIRQMLSYAPDARPPASEIVAACEAMSGQMRGEALKQWCRAQSWTRSRTKTGPLSGVVLWESGEGPPAAVTFDVFGQGALEESFWSWRSRSWGVFGSAVLGSMVLAWALSQGAAPITEEDPPSPARLDMAQTPTTPPAPRDAIAPEEPAPPSEAIVPPPPPRPKKPPSPTLPSLPPSPPPTVEEVIPAAQGSFAIDGPFAEIQLRSPAGETFGPGNLPEGVYEVYARFDGAWVSADLRVSIRSGQRVEIGCNDVRWRCWQR